MRLQLSGGGLDRILEGAQTLLDRYRTDDGLRYLDYRPGTDPNLLVPEDLAVTILINSRVTGRAFKSVQDRAKTLRLSELPDIPLEKSTSSDRDRVADLVAEMASWEGFAASVATKSCTRRDRC